MLKIVFNLTGLEHMSKDNAQRIPTRRIETLVLCMAILLVLSIHIYAISSSYDSVQSINSDNPSGSTLAERYLILGDWPASRVNKLMDFTSGYKISNRPKDKENIKAAE